MMKIFKNLKKKLMTYNLKLTTAKAFTLIEIVVALGVFAIGILGILALFPVGLDAQKRALDYSNVANLAEWKMADIHQGSHLASPNNSITDHTSYPASGSDPAPFNQNPKYLWHYNVTASWESIDDLYRIDLLIYSVEDTSTPVERAVSFIEYSE